MSLTRQALRFGLVGGVNTAIGLASICSLMYFLEMAPASANAFGYGIGLGISFLLNRIWTFKSSRPLKRVLPQFLLVATVSYMLNLGAVMAGLALSDSNPYLMQLAGVVTYAVVMFLGCRLFVFRSNADVCRQQDH